MYELPYTVTVNNQSYAIRNKADYRTILGVIEACADVELTSEEQAVSAIIIFYEGIDTIEDVFDAFGDCLQEAFDAIGTFISLNDDEVGVKAPAKVFDWVQDEKLIISAINNVAGTEVRALPYLHWFTFISYFMAIGDCAFSTIVQIRAKISKGEKLEKYEEKFKRENPQYFRWKSEEREAQLMFESIWNKE